MAYCYLIMSTNILLSFTKFMSYFDCYGSDTTIVFEVQCIIFKCNLSMTFSSYHNDENIEKNSE